MFHYPTLRLIISAIKDAEIANRTKENKQLENSDIMVILKKMIKHRKESAEIFSTSGRKDLEKKENDEIKIIQKYMPLQIDDSKINSILDEAIKETDSVQIRDMGKVMSFLKDNYSGQMDFGKVSGMLKDKLKS